MKLFVWNRPYDIPWGLSMVFAIAETLEEAKAIAETAAAYGYFDDTPDNIPTHVKLGEPSRVVDLPCAEWHWWSE